MQVAYSIVGDADQNVLLKCQHISGGEATSSSTLSSKCEKALCLTESNLTGICQSGVCVQIEGSLTEVKFCRYNIP